MENVPTKKKLVVEALIIVPFGAEVVEPRVEYDVEEWKNNFKSALQIYKSQNLWNTQNQ
jgi:hypothetical protein